MSTKTSITLEFPTLEDAHAALGRLIGAANVTVLAVQPSAAPEPEAEGGTTGGRKRRSDAGQQRGPNARTTGAAAGTAGGDAKVEQSAAATTVTGDNGAKKLTVEDGRAAMKRISGTKGLGMDACMKHLAEFGVDMISKLPADKLGEFIARADAKVAAAKEGAV